MDQLDPTDIQAQDRAAADKQRQQKLAAKTEAADFKLLMSEAWGRRIVWRQLAAAGVFNSTFHTTAMQMAFNEGQRNVGLRLIAQIHEHCPDLYAVMTKEQSK